MYGCRRKCKDTEYPLFVRDSYWIRLDSIGKVERDKGERSVSKDNARAEVKHGDIIEKWVGAVERPSFRRMRPHEDVAGRQLRRRELLSDPALKFNTCTGCGLYQKKLLV